MDATIEKPATHNKPSQQQVKELWAYVKWEAARQNRESKKSHQLTLIREHIWYVLINGRLTDEEALKQIRRLLE